MANLYDRLHDGNKRNFLFSAASFQQFGANKRINLIGFCKCGNRESFLQVPQHHFTMIVFYITRSRLICLLSALHVFLSAQSQIEMKENQSTNINLKSRSAKDKNLSVDALKML